MKNKNTIRYKSDDYLLRNIIVFGMAFFTGMLFLALYLDKPNGIYQVSDASKSNLVPYALLVIIVVVSSLIYNLILVRMNIIQTINKCGKIVAGIICAVIIVINIVLLLYIYLTELNLFDAPDKSGLQYHQCEVLTLLFMACAFISVVYIIETSRRDAIIHSKVYFWGIVLIVVLVNAYILYTPNVFSAYYNLYHGDAYFNSVYRAMRGVPRSSVNTGIYGCYGIIIAPLVLILGGTIKSFYIAIGIIGAISILSIAFALDTFVKTPIIKVIGVVALPIMIMSFQWGVYPQLNPQRLLFSSILIAYLTYLYKYNKDNIKYTILGYVISMFSIMWSTEIGIICTLTFATYTIYKSLVKYSLLQLKLYIDIFLNLIASIITLFASIFVIGVINIIMGGSWISFNDFLFPLLSKSYMVDTLVIKLPYGLTAWIFVIAVFFAFLVNSLMKTKLSPLRIQATAKDNAFFGIAVLGIGQITYYINRAAYGNLSVSYYIEILLACILADWCLSNYKLHKEEHTILIHNIFRAASYIILTTLVIVTFGGISNSFNVENSKDELHIREYDKVECFAKQIEAEIPPNTIAIGCGVAEIYSCLGWDCGYYPIDFSDLGTLPSVADYLNNELSNLSQPVLLDEKSLEQLNSYSKDANATFYKNFTLEKTFTIYEQNYNYYVPKSK